MDDDLLDDVAGLLAALNVAEWLREHRAADILRSPCCVRCGPVDRPVVELRCYDCRTCGRCGEVADYALEAGVCYDCLNGDDGSCDACGGSGGGDDAALRCRHCGGRGA